MVDLAIDSALVITAHGLATRRPVGTLSEVQLRQLSRQAQDGDGHARTRLVEFSFPLVKGLAHQTCGYRGGDIYQELIQFGCYFVLDRVVPTFDGRIPYLVYAKIILGRAMRGHLRRLEKRLEKPQAQPGVPSWGVLDTLCARERSHRLYRALGQLTTEERLVIEERFLHAGSEPLTFQELATMFDTTPRGVRWIQECAFQKLRRALGELN